MHLHKHNRNLHMDLNEKVLFDLYCFCLCGHSILLTPVYAIVTCSHTHPFNGPLSGTTRVSRYQKGKTNLDCTEARDSEWHHLGQMQVCTSFQITTRPRQHPPLGSLQAGCPSCRPTNSVKALKDKSHVHITVNCQSASILALIVVTARNRSPQLLGGC